jgi:hypothetical protein
MRHLRFVTVLLRCQICKQKMTVPNIFRDISKAVRYFFNHNEKVRIILLSSAVKVLGGCDLWRGNTQPPCKWNRVRRDLTMQGESLAFFLSCCGNTSTYQINLKVVAQTAAPRSRYFSSILQLLGRQADAASPRPAFTPDGIFPFNPSIRKVRNGTMISSHPPSAILDQCRNVQLIFAC